MYAPGATLEPDCAPTDSNCGINLVVNASLGGTGISSYTEGDLIYALSPTTLTKLGVGLEGKVLKVSSGLPVWGDDSGGTSYTASEQGLHLDSGTDIFSLVLDGSTLSNSASGLKLSDSYTGQSTINTLGTITTGHWHGENIDIAHGGTGISTTPQNGELLIGNGSGFSLANLTGADGVSITNDSGIVTIGLAISDTPEVTTVANDDYFPIYPTSVDGSRRKITYANLFSGVLGSLSYQGIWNASLNSPTLADGDCVLGNKGKFYINSTAGTTNLGGVNSWSVSDWLICNGTSWEKVANTNSISTVYGRTGAIVATAGDYNALQITNTPTGGISGLSVQAALNELDSEKESVLLAGSSGQYYRGDKTWQTLDTSSVAENLANLYYTNARARGAISSAVTGLSYGSSTGVISLLSGYNLPTDSSVSNWNSAYAWGNHASAGYLTSVNFSQISNGTGVYFDYRPNNVACNNGQELAYNSSAGRWECASNDVLYTATGNGIELSGSTFALELDGSTLSNSASGLKLSDSYTGQSTINTLGTITTGHWHGENIDIAHGGTGISTTPQNGEFLIGNGSGFSLANLTGGDGIVITNSSSTVNIGLSVGATPETTSMASDDYFPIYDTSASGARRKISYSNLFAGVADSLKYQGIWDANNNSPHLANGDCTSGASGNFYISSSATTTATPIVGSELNWEAGDWLVCNGTSWEEVERTVAASSVFGRTGDVVAVSGDYTATQITNVASGTVSATNLQDAVNELDDEKESKITTGTSAQYYRGDKTWQTLDKAAIGLSNVENTGISTWSGSTAITTLGTIISGLWHGSDIALGTYTSGNYVSGTTTGGGLVMSGTEGGTLGILLNGSSLSLGASGLALNLNSENSWGGVQSFSSALVAPTSADSINGLVVNAGALSNVASITGSGALSIAAGGSNTNLTLGSNGTGVVSLDSGTTGAINIGTGASAKIITIGNGTGATSLVLNAGTGNIDIGANAIARVINIGTGAAVVETISIGGTGANVIAIGNTQTAGSVTIGNAMTTGTITIGGSGAQTGAITIGSGTGAQTINLGTGATGAKTINIGSGAVANTLTIGNTTGATQVNLSAGTSGFIVNGLATAASGNLAVCVNNTTKKLYLGNSATSCNPSSSRYKHDIKSLEFGLDKIKGLRPVSFTYNESELKYLGFIAEEVVNVDERLINRNSSGEIEGVNQDEFIPILVKAIQEQSVLLGNISSSSTISGNGLTNLFEMIKTESPVDPLVVISTKITAGEQFLTDFVAARLTAIRGYFNEIFAKQVHTEQLCVKKVDNTEICITGDQLQEMLSNKTGESITISTTVTDPLVEATTTDSLSTTATSSADQTIVEIPADNILPIINQ